MLRMLERLPYILASSTLENMNYAQPNKVTVCVSVCTVGQTQCITKFLREGVGGGGKDLD